jgi:8-oxo-dGTP pyrophosphatase MutT (NUDIX family)
MMEPGTHMVGPCPAENKTRRCPARPRGRYCRQVSTEPLRCTGALIVDDDGRIFFQRRSPERRLFPNCWDIVGGHLEPGEDSQDALRREVSEATGWAVSHVAAWSIPRTATTGGAMETTTWSGWTVTSPPAEAGRHTEFRWLTADDLTLLDENRDVDDGMSRRIAEDAFAALRSIGL